MSKAKIAIVLAFLFTALASADADAQTKSNVIIQELKERLAKTEAVLSAAMKAEATARVEAEQQRKLAEVARKQAEQERAEALEARDEAQRQRQLAEAQRMLAERRLAEALQSGKVEAAARKDAEAARVAAMKAGSPPKAKTPSAKLPKRARRPARRRFAELAEQVEILNRNMKQMQAELDVLRLQIQNGSPMKEPAGEAALDTFRLSPKAQKSLEDYSRQVQEGRDDAKPHAPEKAIDHPTLTERRQQKERDLEMEELRRKLDEVIREVEATRRHEWESRKQAHP